MGLVEDAQKLADTDPFYENERAGTAFCIACGSSGSHNSDCPWLSLPRIVAALGAAERYFRNGDKLHWVLAAQAFGVIKIMNTGPGKHMAALAEPAGGGGETRGE